MTGKCARSYHAGPLIGMALLLGACAGQHTAADNGGDDGINAYPANYKSDIVAGMHAYLNDPTGIRDSAISEPMLKSVGKNTRYVVCVRFNGKQSGNTYAGVKEIAAVFLAGRFDQFVETAREQCANASYTPFPELGKLPR
jgi:hypothetical protein